MELALRTMDSHSQGNIFGPKKKENELTEEDFEEADEIFHEIGLPDAIKTGMSVQAFRDLCHQKEE